jgi:hypothetical protein
VRLIVDHLDQDRQIGRELEQARGVNHTGGAETGDAVNHGRAREPFPQAPTSPPITVNATLNAAASEAPSWINRVVS